MGLDLQLGVGQEHPSLSSEEWTALVRELDKACLSQGRSHREDAFLKVTQDTCLMAKPPTSTARPLSSEGWLSTSAVWHGGGGKYWYYGIGGEYVCAVHSLVCWWFHGAPPAADKVVACHYYCNKSLCLNPLHLCWGSHDDNAYHSKWHHDKKKGAHNGEVAPQKFRPIDWQPAELKPKRRRVW